MVGSRIVNNNELCCIYNNATELTFDSFIVVPVSIYQYCKTNSKVNNKNKVKFDILIEYGDIVIFHLRRKNNFH